MTDSEYYDKLWSESKHRLLGMLALAFALVIVLFLLGSCKAKEKIVEKAVYSHDTAFVTKDSIVYRFFDFSALKHERTASWVVHDTINNTDTLKIERWYEIQGKANDTLQSSAKVSNMSERKDSTVDRSRKTTVPKNYAKSVKIPFIYRLSLGICIILFIFALYKLIRWLKRGRT